MGQPNRIAASFGLCTIHWGRLQQPDADFGVNAQQIATAPAIEGDARKIQNAALNEYWHGPAQSERRSAAYQVAAVTLGCFHIAGFDMLGTDLSGQRLGGDIAVAMHQHDQGLGILVLHDQRFDDGKRIKRKCLRAVPGATVRLPLVDIFIKRHALRTQQACGRCFANVG